MRADRAAPPLGGSSPTAGASGRARRTCNGRPARAACPGSRGSRATRPRATRSSRGGSGRRPAGPSP
eukprot:15446798-Alexandrium_andersonii.AAC.1